MTTITHRLGGETLTAGRLPRATIPVAVVASGVLGYALAVLASGEGNIGLATLFAFLLFLVTIEIATRLVEGPRQAADRRAGNLIAGAFLLALVPLGSVAWVTISKGVARFDGAFFSQSMRNVVGEGGGAVHAIHAGLFAYALMGILIGPGTKSGFSGSIALSVLMIPVVVRACEELLRLVPNELREAAYALGVPKWLTIVRVVIPTAISGIISGVILAIARVIGETAPLLIAMGFTASLNNNLFANPMMTLPVFVYDSYAHPGTDVQSYLDRAWAGALTLILIVMILNLIGRLIARRFAPKTGR